MVLGGWSLLTSCSGQGRRCTSTKMYSSGGNDNYRGQDAHHHPNREPRPNDASVISASPRAVCNSRISLTGPQKKRSQPEAHGPHAASVLGHSTGPRISPEWSWSFSWAPVILAHAQAVLQPSRRYQNTQGLHSYPGRRARRHGQPCLQ